MPPPLEDQRLVVVLHDERGSAKDTVRRSARPLRRMGIGSTERYAWFEGKISLMVARESTVCRRSPPEHVAGPTIVNHGLMSVPIVAAMPLDQFPRLPSPVMPMPCVV